MRKMMAMLLAGVASNPGNAIEIAAFGGSATIRVGDRNAMQQKELIVLKYRENISSIFCINSEAFASELLQNLGRNVSLAMIVGCE